jgi:hypothetical protein
VPNTCTLKATEEEEDMTAAKPTSVDWHQMERREDGTHREYIGTL